MDRLARTVAAADLTGDRLHRVLAYTETKRQGAENRLRDRLDQYWAARTSPDLMPRRAADLLVEFLAYATETFLGAADRCAPLFDGVGEYEAFLIKLLEWVVTEILPPCPPQNYVGLPIIGLTELLSDFAKRLPVSPLDYRHDFQMSGDWEILLEDIVVQAIRSDLSLDFAEWFQEQPFVVALRNWRNWLTVSETLNLELSKEIPTLKAQWWEQRGGTLPDTLPPGNSNPIPPQPKSASYSERDNSVFTYLTRVNPNAFEMTDSQIIQTHGRAIRKEVDPKLTNPPLRHVLKRIRWHHHFPLSAQIRKKWSA